LGWDKSYQLSVQTLQTELAASSVTPVECMMELTGEAKLENGWKTFHGRDL